MISGIDYVTDDDTCIQESYRYDCDIINYKCQTLDFGYILKMVKKLSKNPGNKFPVL